MAVGKGSMARASKAAATKKGDVNAAVVANPDEKVIEAVAVEVKEEESKAEAKKAAPKKTTAKKTTTKKTTIKKAASKKEETVAASAVVEATSEQVMKQIADQKSEVKGNEFCLIGEEMPVYLF